MAWTQADITALKAALATGAKTVLYQDRRVTYRDLDEMRELLAMMEKEISTSTKTGVRRYADTKGGW